MSATKAAPQINRKQTRVEVDDQIQKSIEKLVMRGMWLEKVLKKLFNFTIVSGFTIYNLILRKPANYMTIFLDDAL